MCACDLDDVESGDDDDGSSAQAISKKKGKRVTKGSGICGRKGIKALKKTIRRFGLEGEFVGSQDEMILFEDVEDLRSPRSQEQRARRRSSNSSRPHRGIDASTGQTKETSRRCADSS